jgi:hypothetical protein
MDYGGGFLSGGSSAGSVNNPPARRVGGGGACVQGLLARLTLAKIIRGLIYAMLAVYIFLLVREIAVGLFGVPEPRMLAGAPEQCPGPAAARSAASREELRLMRVESKLDLLVSGFESLRERARRLQPAGGGGASGEPCAARSDIEEVSGGGGGGGGGGPAPRDSAQARAGALPPRELVLRIVIGGEGE